MGDLIEKLEDERERLHSEAKKYPTGDWRNMYYIGCALGICTALKQIQISVAKEKSDEYNAN